MVSQHLLVACPWMATWITPYWRYSSMQLRQRRFSSDQWADCLRNSLPNGHYGRKLFFFFLEEYFVSIHISLFGQTHDCTTNLATADFYWMKREYRSGRGSWQGAARVSVNPGSYLERPQNSASTQCHFQFWVSIGSRSWTQGGSTWSQLTQTALQLLTVDVSLSFTLDFFHVASVPIGFKGWFADSWCLPSLCHLGLTSSQILSQMRFSQEGFLLAT